MSRTYMLAASVIAPFLSYQAATTQHHRASIKSLTVKIVSSVKLQPVVSLLAHETLKHIPLLDRLLQQCGTSMTELVDNAPLGYVLVYELLLGQKKIRGGGKAKKCIMEIHEDLKRFLQMEDSETTSREKVAMKSRHARINTFRVTTDPHTITTSLHASMDANLRNVISLPTRDHLPSSHPLVQDGSIILQDRASCFPAEALVQALERKHLLPCDVIDATAAPGNKTTQLASLVIPYGGHVFAFDRSPDRFAILNRRIQEAGVPEQFIHTAMCDFSTVDLTLPQYRDVKAILLDPSCSGSGLPSSIERDFERAQFASQEEFNKEQSVRLNHLAAFQLRLLRHALSFPQIQIVSYSTCSIHEEENERVVNMALQSAEGRHWKLSHALPFIKRRGIVSTTSGLTPQQAAMVVRADPVMDDTHGFFVAVFERKRHRDHITHMRTKCRVSWARFRKTRQIVKLGTHLWIRPRV